MNDCTNGFFGMGMGMGYMWIVPILAIAALLFLFRDQEIKEPTAQEILDKRFANGGISKEEYEEKSKYLKNARTSV